MQQTNPIQTCERARAAEDAPALAGVTVRARRRRRDSGAMLLAVLFMMAMMIIAALVVAPALIHQAKRDREEEMIHRGTEYARAVKKYYKRFGRYPANLEQLDNTNQIRFLRRRFKDPLTKEGEWKLLHFADIQAIAGLGTGFGIPGQPGQQGAPGVTVPKGGGQGASTAPLGAQLSPQQQGGTGAGNLTQGVTEQGGSPFASPGGGATGQSGFSLAPGVGQNSGAGAGQGPGTNDQPGQTGSNNTIFGNTGVGGQTFGGGPIVGVASKSKDPTIRIYNQKKKYDEWVFIYSPMMDRMNTLLRGPYNGLPMNGSQFGTPAGQLNQGGSSGQQPSGFGQQQPGGLGQQTPQPSQQPNQQLTPGNQFPPDQSQPHP